MFQLMISDQSQEVKAITAFLKWKEVNYQLVINPNDILFLNQGKDIPLFIKDSMIIARGFYDVISYIKQVNQNDIDTISDIVKDNDENYRALVERTQAKKVDTGIYSDGFELYVK